MKNDVMLRFFLLLTLLPASLLYAPECSDSSCNTTQKKQTKPQRKAPQQQKTPTVFSINNTQDFMLPACAQIQIPVVFLVSASWCKPCQQVAPVYEALAQTYRFGIDALFCKIMINEKPALSSPLIQSFMSAFGCSITAVPTFIVMHKGEIQVLKGSDKVHEIKAIFSDLTHKYPRAQSVTTANIEKLIYQSKKPVIVKLHAFWCPPCSMMEAIFEAAEKKYCKHCTFLRLDTMESPELAEQLSKAHNVQGIPAFFCFKKGKVVKTIVGGRSQEDFFKEIEEFTKK